MDETAMMLRRATAEDGAALRGLAELDSARPLDGAILLVEVDGELRAARSLADGRTISDPFRSAGAARELLAVQARQVAAAQGRRVGQGRRLRSRQAHAAL